MAYNEKIMELFYEMLQVALRQRDILSHNPSNEEWTGIFKLSQKQAIAGCLFSAINELSKQGQKPPLPLLYEWIALAEQIKQRNIFLNQRCIELIRLFADGGFNSCILKGQGNSLMYPDPLLRTSGDIDIWVRGERSKIIEFCKTKTVGKVSIHHLQFPIWKDVEVEVHFVPSYTKVPRFAIRTQLFFEKFGRVEIDGKGLFPEGETLFVPSKEMNLVFQMSHLARHFFGVGIGMRQILDYYYLLKYINTNINTRKLVDDLRNLGLYKFAGAVMWVLKEVFGAEDDLLFVPMDEKRGKLLLDEILAGGNFGHHDKRAPARMKRKSSTVALMVRNLRLLRLFPEEAFWSPIMGVWYHLKYKWA